MTGRAESLLHVASVMSSDDGRQPQHPVGPPLPYTASSSTLSESPSLHRYTRDHSRLSHHHPTTANTPPDSSDNDDDEHGHGPIYTSWNNGHAANTLGNPSGTSITSSSPPTSAVPGPSTASNDNTPGTTTGLRSRFFNGLGRRFDDLHIRNTASSSTSRNNPKLRTISTTPGQLCAGETETEADEPPCRLPTARIVPSSDPIIPPNNVQQRLTPLLFEFSRLLAVVPAVVGTLYNLYHVYCPPASSPYSGRKSPGRIDYFVSALWAILTGYQCLALTTSLLTRWRLYYPPLSTLIRLLALQGICWPATQLTLSLFEHEKRPVVVWALIGTTTCTSRSIQIWVTSNLWWETMHVGNAAPVEGGGYWRRWGGRWGGRRWDWKEVSLKCMLPAGIMYFVTAWAEQLRREWE
ncbi:hypothetical protein AX15_004164 [Amanita polypyramis BW_CC]|nr:hypothetical protein AX15_004164 [Amanita polypyramis BW_CC]